MVHHHSLECFLKRFDCGTGQGHNEVWSRSRSQRSMKTSLNVCQWYLCVTLIALPQPPPHNHQERGGNIVVLAKGKQIVYRANLSIRVFSSRWRTNCLGVTNRSRQKYHIEHNLKLEWRIVCLTIKLCRCFHRNWLTWRLQRLEMLKANKQHVPTVYVIKKQRRIIRARKTTHKYSKRSDSLVITHTCHARDASI